ncbi:MULTISPECIES: HipA N-terminal domain-containing protein [Colwellia]|uniref:Toxin-antitoxin system toxin HipA family protein n=1 Tax=Colwellia marinimaniae TaxID=1513592 RepID=A0ABQ0MT77_9GAMM|nr:MULTISPECIES: HipA N-terminal domain-containing protein [Colwellia]GAW95550.1 toxin-antitoxin system toxin HipA family protein [Colwellia marinimaniae]
MSKPSREGYIYCNGSFAGVLQEFNDLKTVSYLFKYDAAYLKNGAPIGHHLPLSEQPFAFDAFPTFFANLISEGWLRTHQAKKARLDITDSFGLLLANGKELIGAISVLTSRTEEQV